MSAIDINNSLSIKTDKHLYDRLQKWRSGVAAVKAGVRDARVLVIGDSTSIGIDGDGYANWPNEYQHLARELTNKGIPSYENSFFGNSAGSGTRLGYDPRIVNNGWSTATQLTLGGTFMQADTIGNNFVFTPTSDCDKFRVYYTVYGGSAEAEVTATGGTTTTIYSANDTNTDGLFSSIVYYVDVDAASLGANSVTIEYSGGSGNFFVAGIEAWDSSQKRVEFMNAGWWGGTSASWTIYGNNYSPLTLLDLLNGGDLDFDLFIIKAGINDEKATTKATFKTKIQTLIDKAVAHGADVLLEIDNPTGQGFDETSDMFSAMKELAEENKLVFVDQIDRFESYTVAGPLGFMSDDQHPSSQGYADMAGYLAKTLIV